jgi:hypothetical protein
MPGEPSRLQLRPITASDLDAVSAFMAEQLKGQGGAARYRRMLEPRWPGEQPNHGYLLQAGSSIVGALGAIYSEQVTAGTTRRFCNMTSWCVDPSHRSSSLKLLLALLAQGEYVFTNFSPTPTVAKIIERAGFQPLDTGKVILPVLPALLPRSTRVLWRAEQVRAVLTAADQKIFDDHAEYRCGRFALVSEQQASLVLTVRRGRDALYFADVLYATQPQWVMSQLSCLSWPLLRRHGTLAVGIDSRFVAHPPRLHARLARPSYFRGEGLSAAQVSSAYSELLGMYA